MTSPELETAVALELFREQAAKFVNDKWGHGKDNVVSSLRSLPTPNAAEARRIVEDVERLRNVLARCRTVLGNMALERKGAVFNRWPVSHEPLRSDARTLLPLIDAALAARQGSP